MNSTTSEREPTFKETFKSHALYLLRKTIVDILDEKYIYKVQGAARKRERKIGGANILVEVADLNEMTVADKASIQQSIVEMAAWTCKEFRHAQLDDLAERLGAVAPLVDGEESAIKEFTNMKSKLKAVCATHFKRMTLIDKDNPESRKTRPISHVNPDKLDVEILLAWKDAIVFDLGRTEYEYLYTEILRCFRLDLNEIKLGRDSDSKNPYTGAALTLANVFDFLIENHCKIRNALGQRWAGSNELFGGRQHYEIFKIWINLALYGFTHMMPFARGVRAIVFEQVKIDFRYLGQLIKDGRFQLKDEYEKKLGSIIFSKFERNPIISIEIFDKKTIREKIEVDNKEELLRFSPQYQFTFKPPQLE